MAPEEHDAPVLLRTEGRAAYITLNRPRAINALTHPMVRTIDAALAGWESDDAVATVVVSGAGERGLCAGGDIRAIHDDARAGGRASVGFWRDEYRLNARIARFPKPYVALMDGIVMGGGVGVSAHGSVRVVTERSRIAMPETGIGFVPDVGGTHLLARAPGELGTHLALTGEAVGAGDALLLGLVDHFVPSARLADLAAAVASEDVTAAVRRYAEPAPAGRLAGARAWIDHCYAADTVEDIVDRLLASGESEAKETAETILGRSPRSLKVTLESIRRARVLGELEPVLEQEFRVSCAALSSPDLVEGIRAQVVDKDRCPRWSPPELSGVTRSEVERHFAPPAVEGLGLAR
ncbi:enoyl-CoA hydratase/isomerase family protein [Streptomyces sp. PKU-EA00015]|uniref:enoyl-CoA hydratase/isomerase family protein n=1 Tax=Streptomyces sp. PKU-EA00015 TaxID=2748326 RepID=UPI00159FD119|nr:enoyl-CoA hydratase/isomerase family protein [Streptomyces sp. PKU-EA00015]NWF25420.1 enoyl-CoA hydratase/isomerase family protein [Streptomyces sp. PKU-EA00015]